MRKEEDVRSEEGIDATDPEMATAGDEVAHGWG
jgi:hypothetical protein